MPVETIPDDLPEPSWDEDEADQDQADFGQDQDIADHDRADFGDEQAPFGQELAAFGHEQAAATLDRPDDTLQRAAGMDPSGPRSRSSRRRPHGEPKRGAALSGWMLFTLCVAALVAGVFFGRQKIMAWAPETEPLYILAGLTEEPPIPPLPAVRLRLREVTSGRRQVNGTQELVIEGEIFNPTDQPQDVPPLVATLMDPTGIELKRWEFAAESQVLPPGGRVGFQTSTPNPPGQGNLNLNFVPKND
jgi:Protein of unknown function (DUF3426)